MMMIGHSTGTKSWGIRHGRGRVGAETPMAVIGRETSHTPWKSYSS